MHTFKSGMTLPVSSVVMCEIKIGRIPTIWPRDYKTYFMLNATKQEI